MSKPDWRWAVPTDRELSKMALAEERAKMQDEYGNLAQRGLDPTDGNEDFTTDNPHD